MRVPATAQAATSSTYSATASQVNAVRPVCRARPAAPVTHVPTGKVKPHHVIANGIPPRTARTSRAADSPSHSSAKPITGTPYSTANTPSAEAYGAWIAPGATSASALTAVVDWPSGPSTRNRVGVSTSGSGPRWTSRAKISGSITSVASRLSPNIA